MGHVAAPEPSIWGGGIQSRGVRGSTGALPHGGAGPGAVGNTALPEPRGSIRALPFWEVGSRAVEDAAALEPSHVGRQGPELWNM
jgi:hypothetical protein